MYIVFTGLAGACKLSGFFSLIFIFWYLALYINSSKKMKIGYFLSALGGTILIYCLVNVAILDWNVMKFWNRTQRAVVYHNTEMLPEKYEEYMNEKERSRIKMDGTLIDFKGNLYGGYKGFLHFVFQNQVIYFLAVDSNYEIKDYTLSNNQFMGTGLFVIILITIIFGLGKLIRIRQGLVGREKFLVIEDKRFVFLIIMMLSLTLPWVFIPRVQYNFYYVISFPFIILWMCLFLFKFVNKKLSFIFILAYFSFFIYRIKYWIPI